MTVNELIKEFRTISQQNPGPAPDTAQWVLGDSPEHVVFGMITHGNETGSLPAIKPFVDYLESEATFKGTVSIFLGNAAAALKNSRYLEADLNRVFTDQPSESSERQRAVELSPLLDKATLLVDFHQTILASHEPFYIFPFHNKGYQWARYLRGAKSLVTRHPNYQFSAGSMCTDEYVLSKGGAGVTLEMGQLGISDWATDLTLTTMKRAIHGAARAKSSTDLEALIETEALPELNFFEITYAEPFREPQMHLAPGWINFAQVEEGCVLGQVNDTESFTAPKSGMLLFPKYPPRKESGDAQDPIPKEIYNLASPMAGHPLDLWPELR